MTESPLDAQKRKEAQARYDNLNRRIAAVDRDIDSETDGERLATLHEKRADLARQRDAVSAEMEANEKRTNGDLETLQRKVNELSRALSSGKPTEAHEIINEAVETLMKLDNRVLGLEGRVKAIERHIHPPWVVTMLRMAAVLTVFLALVIGVWQFPVLVMYPIIGLTIEGALLSLAVMFVFQANAYMERNR